MYWVWGSERTAENEAMIYGPLLDEDDEPIEFDAGFMQILEDPPVEIVYNDDNPGVLADNILLRGGGGLLFSSRLRKLLEKTGCNNIQYFPVTLRNAANGAETSNYCLSNILGRIACLDRDHSEFEVSEEDEDRVDFIEALAIDEKKILGFDLFRLHEDPEIIIASERVKKICEKQAITGLKFYAPGDYL